MELEDNSASPEDAYYRRIDAAWKEAGAPKPDEISKLALREYDHALSPQTIKEWLIKKRIPRLADPRSREHFKILLKVLDAPGTLAQDWEPLVLAASQAKTARRSKRETAAEPPSDVSSPTGQMRGEQRSRGASAEIPDQPPATTTRVAPATPSNPRRRQGIGRWGVVVLTAVVVVAVGGLIAARAFLVHGRAGQALTDSAAVSTSGLRVVAIPVPVKSLTAPLALRLGRQPGGAGTVIGFKFTNDADDLCLNANKRGDSAGHDGDTVHMWDCYDDPVKVWFPVQWDRSKSDRTWLVNQKYQSKCLDAVTIGGAANGRPVQLWECGDSTGEQYWDFGDWYRNVNQKSSPAPLELNTGPYGLDADASKSRNGDPVRIWKLRNTTNQLWF